MKDPFVTREPGECLPVVNIRTASILRYLLIMQMGTHKNLREPVGTTKNLREPLRTTKNLREPLRTSRGASEYVHRLKVDNAMRDIDARDGGLGCMY